MSTNSTRVDVKILDKEFQVACPQEERHSLLEAAQELNERMVNVRNSGAIVGMDRIAVMVALNLCYELRQLQAKQTGAPVNSKDIDRLLGKLEQALSA